MKKKFLVFLTLLLTLFELQINYSNAKPLKYETLPAIQGVRTAAVLKNRIIIRLKPGSDITTFIISNKENSAVSAMENLLNPNITLTHNAAKRKAALLQSSSRTNEILKAEQPLLRTFYLDYDGDMAPEDFCRKLKKENNAVEIAEPCYINSLQATPNDSLTLQQAVLYTINAFEAWDVTKGDTNMIIGISDNGIIQTHEDLNPNIARNWGEIPGDYIDNDGNGYVDDFIGYNMTYEVDGKNPGDTYNDSMLHGTAVAGMAAAATDNTRGMAGVAYKCRFFPIKASPLHENDLTHGYESIIYAAVRGCKVLNLSWGSPKAYSEIDQSVIDYAVAHDVAIVAAGGNYMQVAAATMESTHYPAGYRGVLGVGVTDQADIVTSNSTLGPPVRIMAPGDMNYATTHVRNGYAKQSDGTSFATPVVSAAVALVRCKYPNLSAVQALEFTRQCVDDIAILNPNFASIVPGRVNLAKAMITDPFSIPGIVHTGTEFRTESGLVTDRFSVNENAVMNIKIKNYLGEAKNLRFSLSVAYDNVGLSVIVIDSVVNVATLPSGAEITLSSFKFKINENSTSKILFRVDITGENGFRDFFKIPFTPTTDLTTFSNEHIAFSLSDRGNFGYNNQKDNKQGVGFVVKGYGSQIWEGGVLACASNAKAISTVQGSYFDGNDFSALKPFIQPNRNIGMITDERAHDRIGLDIQQIVFLNQGSDKTAKIRLSVRNQSGADLSDVAVGYFLDWDIGLNSSENKVGLLPEAIPASKQGLSSAAEFAMEKETYPVIGSAVYSAETEALAQAAGLHFGITGINMFTDDKKIKALSSGTSWQTDTLYDISFVIGMKYPGVMKPNDERICWVCIGTGANKDELANNLKMCLDTETGINEFSADGSIAIYPQPAKETINVSGAFPLGQVEITLSDILGKIVFHSSYTNNSDRTDLQIDTKSIGSGVYFLRIRAAGKLFSKNVIILK